jgi:hypothetical protein
MAERIEIKSVTTPAGTTVAAPQTTLLNWRQGYPVRVEIRFPPGPSGLVGFQLLHSGEVVVPHDPTEWLITDDEPVVWPLDEFPYNAKYSVRTYNLDVYPHTIQVRMLFNEVGAQSISPIAIIPLVTPLAAAVEG